MQNNKATPARLTTTATSKLPRSVLFVAGIIYILAGLFFRDPWKTDDVVGLATMLNAIYDHDNGVWLHPQIAGLEHAGSGPLSTWLGALFIFLLAPIIGNFTSPIDAAIISSRIPNLMWFAITCSSVWYGTYLLGRRPEPQPLALPFGGEPEVKDYGRMIADAALLLLVATAGILWRMHETSYIPALIASQALCFYAIARIIDRPVSGSITLGLALSASFLANGTLGLLPVVIATIICFCPASILWQQKKWLAASLVIAIVICATWWALALNSSNWWSQQWVLSQKSSWSWPTLGNTLNTARDLPWFLWPTWPFAVMALWQWRQWLLSPHILVPFSFFISALLSLPFIVGASEPHYSLLAIPSAILASFALPTLRRGVVNALDWFAVMCFTLAIATVWLGWVALHSGWPPKISHNITRLIEGYDTEISWVAIFIATAGTAAWLALVRWRLIHRPLALWRGTVLSAGGLIATWLLLATLWMPVLDYARSYRTVSAELSKALSIHKNSNDCIRTLGVGKGQRASFYAFNGIRFSYNTQCNLILQQTTVDQVNDGTAFTPSGTTVIWQGKRQPDRHEMFRLLQTTGNNH